jgi:glucose-6-phosphate 1-dehydrogenase
MVPNHLFQLLAMTAMEPPISKPDGDFRQPPFHVFAGAQISGGCVRWDHHAGKTG